MKDVCEICLDVAYNNGFSGTVIQSQVMRDWGSDVEDHNCIVNMEPNEDFECGCSCPKS